MVGTVAGRAGAEIGKTLAEEWGLPTSLGAGLGAFALHYLAGSAARTLVNAGMLDVSGTAVSVAATTPLVSMTHGLIEGAIEFFS
jgi:hypothetical protein